MQIPVVRNILEANARIAADLKDFFAKKGILVLNLMSSPGAGKTTVLERTLSALAPEMRMAVVEGDLQTDNDARRVAATGAQAVQINTEGGCHLTSSQVQEAIKSLDLEGLDVLFIENVGNLVCPAEFDVGEDFKITLLSVAEGDDKPEKYPLMFHISAALLLNKVDLLPYVDFDLERASRHARVLNECIEVFPVSARSGEGLDVWYDWLRRRLADKRAAA